MTRTAPWWMLSCALAGCGRIAFDAPATSDAAGDALGAWSAPQPVIGANTSADEEDVTLSSNKLEIFFAVGGDAGPKMLWTMTRPSDTSAWSAPSLVSDLDTSDWTSGPRLTPDDKRMYFASDRKGDLDIWTASRAAVGSPWEDATRVDGPSLAGSSDYWFAPCSGTYYVMARETPTFQLYEGDVSSATAPTLMSLNNADTGQSGPFLTADCLTLYFASDQRGSSDLYVTHRASLSSPWQAPEALDELNDPVTSEADPWISPDGRLFAFSSDRSGVVDVYLSSR